MFSRMRPQNWFSIYTASTVKGAVGTILYSALALVKLHSVKLGGQFLKVTNRNQTKTTSPIFIERFFKKKNQEPLVLIQNGYPTDSTNGPALRYQGDLGVSRQGRGSSDPQQYFLRTGPSVCQIARNTPHE